MSSRTGLSATLDERMVKKKIFISHISEESALAHAIQERLETDFLGLVDIFVSSDTDSIAAGSNWLKSIEAALKSAKVLLVLCSPASVVRPWINFEAGVAWARAVPIVPLCHSGLEPSALPMPLSILQAAKTTDPEGVQRVYKLVANKVGCKVPKSGLTDFIAVAQKLETAVTAQSFGGFPTSVSVTAHGRIRAYLEQSRLPFTSINRLAIAGGVSEDEALAILRSDPDVTFSKGKSGNRIAKLKTR